MDMVDPRTLWVRFRQLPTWVQVIAWIAAWPVLGALAIWKSDPTGTAARAGAAAVLLVGGILWLPVLTGAGTDGNDLAAADGDVTEPADGASSEVEVPASPDDGPSPSSSPSSSPAPSPSPSPAPAPSPSSRPTVEAATAWTVTNIVDGDTIDVMADDGTFERIRIIGIDTPERGECGFTEASDELAILILNEKVELVAGARDDRDRYDRLLRYIDVDGMDAGLVLIEEGLAIARYDSRDGYGRHPREGEYVAADAAAPQVCAAPAPSPSPTKSEAPPAPPPPAATEDDTAATNPWGTASCDPAYDPCVPPKSETGDLNCPAIRSHYPGGVSVDHAHGDPHGLDRDKDGRGCE